MIIDEKKIGYMSVIIIVFLLITVLILACLFYIPSDWQGASNNYRSVLGI